MTQKKGEKMFGLWNFLTELVKMVAITAHLICEGEEKRNAGVHIHHRL